MARVRPLDSPKPEVKVVRRRRNPTTPESRRLDEQTLGFKIEDNEFEIFGLPAVAHRLHCTQARVVQLVTEGKLKGHKFGRVWIVTDRDLGKYVKVRRNELRSRYQGYLEDDFQPKD